MDKVIASLEVSHSRLALYSPVNFLRNRISEAARLINIELVQALKSDAACVFEGELPFKDSYLIYRKLAWDTDYFGIPTYRIDFIGNLTVSMPPNIIASTKLIHAFLSYLSRENGVYYVFAEVPSEDLTVLQSLTLAGMKLVETRLTYQNTDIKNYQYSARFPVRLATEEDISSLKQAAKNARNVFDRFHADPFFSTAAADEFLATYIENSIKGYADIVLIPDIEGEPSGAFFTANFCKDLSNALNTAIARIALVAVSASLNGWCTKLMSEMSYLFREHNFECGFITTQSTNRAMIRVCEKLGYDYGRASHIFAIDYSLYDSLKIEVAHAEKQ